jgi:hypothetical protein
MAKKAPSAFARGDGPRPASLKDLITEIKGLAAVRRREALDHEEDCPCDGCRVARRAA